MRRLTATAACLLSLLTVSTAQAHRPGLHTRPLETPMIHWIKALRAKTDAVRSEKCLSPQYRQFNPAYMIPRGLRTWVVVVESRRWAAALRASSACTPWYITAQINAGNVLGRESRGDPWPNCPDPWDGAGYSWWDTVGCENGGSWLDSPGFYRCGLQFHPMWERRFGRLCP